MSELPPTFYWGLGAVVVLAIATYAHRQIPRLIAVRWQALLVHAVLALTGGLFGYAAYSDFAAVGHDAPGVLIFLTGFGAIHVPAAAILFFKRRL
jgi:hypothetical protein